jgi:hypothetical protein
VFRHLRRLPALIVVLGVMATGCGSGHQSTASAPNTAALPPAGNTVANLRATAVAWAHAFLVGSFEDIRALQGPECADPAGTTLPIATVNQYLQRERAVMASEFGRPLDQIKITGVAMRNDDWVGYAIHGGRWKVSDCRAPIGGSSTSPSATVATR